MNFFRDAILAAIFSSISIIILKYLCIESSIKIIQPILNVILLCAVLFIIVFFIGNLYGSPNFKLIKPQLSMTKYENKMYWIGLIYILICLIFIFFSIRSYYYSENPAFTQAVIYSNLIIIYLFSVYFLGSKITLQSALGILLAFIGICLISTNRK